MTKSIRLVLFLFILSVVTLISAIAIAAPRAQEYTGTRWEYLTVSFFLDSKETIVSAPTEDEDATVQTALDDLGPMNISSAILMNTVGARGWELVQIERLEGETRFNNYTFKRPIIE